jgi:hypothetical protein
VIEFISGEVSSDDIAGFSASKKEIAQEKILELLSGGARQSGEIMDVLINAGIGESTINAAKREAFIESRKIGDNWLWFPPGQDVSSTVD